MLSLIWIGASFSPSIPDSILPAHSTRRASEVTGIAASAIFYPRGCFFMRVSRENQESRLYVFYVLYGHSPAFSAGVIRETSSLPAYPTQSGFHISFH
jgi:hypothetical protein